MSSFCSHYSAIKTPTTTFEAPNLYPYNNTRHRHRYLGEHLPVSPRSDNTIEPLTSTNSDYVIREKANSCMHYDSDPSNRFPPHNGWFLSSDHDYQAAAAATWRAQPQQIPRSVQPSHESWSMQSITSDGNSQGFGGLSAVDGLKRQNSHQRASSTSTIASNGPASPYSYSSPTPLIANTEVAPFDHSVDLTKETYLSQHSQSNDQFLSANYLPPQAFNKALHGQRFYNFSQDYSMSQPDRQPSAPSSVSEESDTRHQGLRPDNGGKIWAQEPASQPTEVENRALHPHVQLSRTESAAYQDELYNPANFTSSATSRPNRPQVTMPAQRTLVNQYLESANMARSASPNSAVSRERSPFRDGSELAPSEASWGSPKNPIQTAASRRQQLKLEREQAELAAHRPQLQREPTKTISPKDALLDFNEPDQPPLIQDVVPAGYKQHLGGSEPYSDTSALKTASYNIPQPNQQKNMAGFRAASGDAFTTPNFQFSPPSSQATSMPNPFQMGAYQHMTHLDPNYAAVSLAETTPQFPATLTSMESSISDQTPALSSQDSISYGLTRPADTRANTGTYTCTFHGCAQRFDSPALLQKHKREYHRSQQQQHVRESLSVEASSESPRSTASPGPAGTGLTSAQILARNSQAGPHKCTRTNPSTGKPCNTVFSRPYDLTRHEDTIHNGRKHKVKCPYCREEKTFSRNDALTRHMRVVHPDVENFGKRRGRGD